MRVVASSIGSADILAFAEIWASWTSSTGTASSDFRISMAPVSISVAVLTGATASTSTLLSDVGLTDRWSGAAMSWAASNSFSRPAASPVTSPSGPVSPRPMSPDIASGSAISGDGARPAISMAAAGRRGPCVSGCICGSMSAATVSTTSVCGVCIIANRLANSARVSESAPRFSSGAPPFCDMAGPVPNACIVFIENLCSMAPTGQKPTAKKKILRQRCKKSASPA